MANRWLGLVLVSAFLGGCSMRINGIDLSDGSISWMPKMDAPVHPSKLKTSKVSEEEAQEEQRVKPGRKAASLFLIGLQYSLGFLVFLYVLGS